MSVGNVCPHEDPYYVWISETKAIECPSCGKYLSGDTQRIAWSSVKDADLSEITGTHRIPILVSETPVLIRVKSVRLMVGTAPTGAAIIIDIHKNGTTIFTTQGNRPTIAISAEDSGEVTNMDVTALTNDDYLTMDIDQIGSTIPGKDLVVELEFEVGT